MKKYAIGFDIGGTKCAVVYGSYDEQIEIIDKIKFATSSISSPLEIVNTLCDKTLELLKKHGKTLSCLPCFVFVSFNNPRTKGRINCN